MSNQYDLAIAKMELAKTLALAAYEKAQKTNGAESNIELLGKLFKTAYAAVMDAVGPTIIESVVPGPEESEKL